MSKQSQLAVLVREQIAEPPWGLCISPDLPVPEPGEGDILVRITAAPVSTYDNYFLYPKEYVGDLPIPSVPGLEGAGIVQIVGKGVSTLSAGQRVALCCMPLREGKGSWQRYVTLRETSLMPVPKAVSEAAAAQAYINPVTAYQLLEELQIPKGQWLLHSASSSTIGRLLIQMARHEGLKTISLVRSADAAAELQDLGSDRVIFTGADVDIAAEVREITGGHMAYAALDAVAGEASGQLLQAVRNGGTLIVYGLLGSTSIQTDVADLLFRGKVVRGFGMRGWWEQQPQEKQRAVFGQVLQWLAEGVISLTAGQTFPLERAAEAVMLTHKSGRGPKPLLVPG